MSRAVKMVFPNGWPINISIIYFVVCLAVVFGVNSRQRMFLPSAKKKANKSHDTNRTRIQDHLDKLKLIADAVSIRPNRTTNQKLSRNYGDNKKKNINSQPVPPSVTLDEFGNHKFVFVGGLPQSGTSLLRQMILTDHSSGQDRCQFSTKCLQTNIEGQWLLDDDKANKNKLRVLYGPGDLNNFLTEKNLGNHRIENKDENELTIKMRIFLWGSWSRYWDMNKTFLVEKSPPNILKMPFLSKLFNSPKFLMIIKDPITNSHFIDPRSCYDLKSCDPLNGSPHQDMFQKLKTKESSCDRKHIFCENKHNMMRARVTYLKDWVLSHEVVLDQLNDWELSLTHARFVRYEHIASACVCERLVRFAYSDAQGLLLIPGSDVNKACKHAIICSDKWIAAPSTGRNLGYSNELERRQLAYDGNVGSTVRIRKDVSSKARYASWRAQLVKRGSEFDNVTLFELHHYEPRLNTLGYSIFKPGEKFYTAKTDVFHPWRV